MYLALFASRSFCVLLMFVRGERRFFPLVRASKTLSKAASVYLAHFFGFWLQSQRVTSACTSPDISMPGIASRDSQRNTDVYTISARSMRGEILFDVLLDRTRSVNVLQERNGEKRRNGLFRSHIVAASGIPASLVGGEIE